MSRVLEGPEFVALDRLTIRLRHRQPFDEVDRQLMLSICEQMQAGKNPSPRFVRSKSGRPTSEIPKFWVAIDVELRVEPASKRAAPASKRAARLAHGYARSRAQLAAWAAWKISADDDRSVRRYLNSPDAREGLRLFQATKPGADTDELRREVNVVRNEWLEANASKTKG